MWAIGLFILIANSQDSRWVPSDYFNCKRVLATQGLRGVTKPIPGLEGSHKDMLQSASFWQNALDRSMREAPEDSLDIIREDLERHYFSLTHLNMIDARLHDLMAETSGNRQRQRIAPDLTSLKSQISGLKIRNFKFMIEEALTRPEHHEESWFIKAFDELLKDPVWIDEGLDGLDLVLQSAPLSLRKSLARALPRLAYNAFDARTGTSQSAKEFWTTHEPRFNSLLSLAVDARLEDFGGDFESLLKRGQVSEALAKSWAEGQVPKRGPLINTLDKLEAYLYSRAVKKVPASLDFGLKSLREFALAPLDYPDLILALGSADSSLREKAETAGHRLQILHYLTNPDGLRLAKAASVRRLNERSRLPEVVERREIELNLAKLNPRNPLGMAKAILHEGDLQDLKAWMARQYEPFKAVDSRSGESLIALVKDLDADDPMRLYIESAYQDYLKNSDVLP